MCATAVLTVPNPGPALHPPCPPPPCCQVLKLSKEKWEEARDHAMRAVVADNRMRIWCAPGATGALGQRARVCVHGTDSWNC